MFLQPRVTHPCLMRSAHSTKCEDEERNRFSLLLDFSPGRKGFLDISIRNEKQDEGIVEWWVV